nr:hypothetical protein [Legionella geestiana]
MSGYACAIEYATIERIQHEAMDMGFFRLIGGMAFLSLLTLTASADNGAKQNAFRSFWHPTYHGKRLDYCSLDGKKCGMPIANAYCRAMGYARADQMVKAPNLGMTHYIGTPAHCKGWRCNGFMLIDCVEKLSHTPPASWHYRLRDFVYPRHSNYRISWCYDGDKGCGKRAAHSFCRRMGYLEAKSYKVQEHVPATKALGTDELCFGNDCRGFLHIACAR